MPSFRILALGLVACAAFGADDAPGDDFEKANRFYDAGKFVEAKRLYEKLVDEGAWSGNLFYNLGNADYRIGAPGPAMVNYERALVLAPSHPEALANLRMLREQSHARMLEGPIYERLLLRVQERAWILIATGAVWLCVLFIVLIFTLTRGSRTGLWLGSVASLILAGIAGWGILLHERDRSLAIVTVREAEARLTPVDTAGLAEVLPTGSRVRVLSERGQWIYCELPERRRGWIPLGAIERVRLERS